MCAAQSNEPPHRPHAAASTMTGAIYLLFFGSGFSALVYQVVWVRVFGNVFGSTVYSASLVLAVFMLGLGAGSYMAGAWADNRQARFPGSLLAVYGYVELAIAAVGLAISTLLPHLGRLSAFVSAYTTDQNGWQVLTSGSYIARVAICILLLAPITALMGATLTLLIRHLVRGELAVGSSRIAVLYGVNTLGAALGAFLTDYAIVPVAGLRAAQWTAVLLNLIAGVLALTISTRFRKHQEQRRTTADSAIDDLTVSLSEAWIVGLALAATGFAGMGLEIIWFRHFTLLLGQLRAVYSMLLTVVLLGIGVGSLIGSVLNRRTSRAAEWLMVTQALFGVFVLWGLATPSTRALSESAIAAGRINLASAAARQWAELWFNFTPLVIETFGPALLMGLAFPLANRLVQRDERPVGARAGILYFSNTVGAVGGALATGFLILPTLGIQRSGAVLATIGWLSVVPIFLVARNTHPVELGPRAGRWHRPTTAFSGSVAIFVLTLLTWLQLPPTFLLSRALLRPSLDERLIALDEGVNEVVAVTEFDGDRRRWLLTNGYPMSSTGPIEQR